FEQIWNGARRSSLMSAMSDGFDLAGCRTNCRMDESNRYLWELSHPAPHVNFI
ncbi:MAG: radical SAM protein, partial [Verrucomicrobia bacterium]|nr:radical SAM protein [Deltaproteobacteria bacterium]